MHECMLYNGRGSVPYYYLLNIDPDYYGKTYEEIIGNPGFHQHIDECLRELYPNLYGKDLSMFRKRVFLILSSSFKKIII